MKRRPCMLTEKIQAFKTKRMRKLRISYSEHKTNDWGRSKINFLVGPQKRLTATVKRWKLTWFGHVTRHDSLSKTVLQGTLEGGQHHGQQRKCWTDDIKVWTSLPCQNCSRGPPAEKTGRGSLLNRPLCPPDDPSGQETELKCK